MLESGFSHVAHGTLIPTYRALSTQHVVVSSISVIFSFLPAFGVTPYPSSPRDLRATNMREVSSAELLFL